MFIVSGLVIRRVNVPTGTETISNKSESIGCCKYKPRLCLEKRLMFMFAHDVHVRSLRAFL